MKKRFLIIVISLAVLALLVTGYWLYQTRAIWKTYSFGLSGKNLATIQYPDKYKNVSGNASLPDQKVGLFSIANVINFQLSNEPQDKDIRTYISSVIPEPEGTPTSGIQSLDSQSGSQLFEPEPQSRRPVENDKSTVDINYKTAKYGFNTVYFINEYNSSPDFVVGDLFDGKGYRLNFSYHAKNVKAKEIKAIIAKIKF